MILLSETWCNNNITNNVLSINNYDFILELRCYRNGTRYGIGGGLLVYAKKELQILSHDKQIDYNQYVHFSLQTCDNPTNIFLIYKPPSSNPANIEKLNELIKSVPNNSILIGDFNFPKIDWRNSTAENNNSQHFLDSCIENNLTKYVDFATHNRNNILDLVLANDNCVLNVSDLGHIGNRDHTILKIMTDHTMEKDDSVIEIKEWKKANYENMKRCLNNIDWIAALNDKNTEDGWSFFSQVLDEIVTDNVPTRKINKNGKPAWMTRDIIRLGNKKSRLYKKMKSTQSQLDQDNYKRITKEYKKRMRAAKRRLEVKISKSHGNSGKKMFNQYIKNKLSNKTGIGPLINGNEVVTDDQKMASILNEHFCSIFSEDDGNNHNFTTQPPEELLTDMNITMKMVKDKIEQLKPRKAPGPDGITNDILKVLKDEVATPIHILFQSSLSTGNVPSQWRVAKVVPMFKKGAKGKAGNYRSLSLTCQVGKVFESILRDVITDHLLINCLINPSQHGFMPNRSCQTNLLEFLDKVLEMLDDNDPVDIVYLDFSRAFDQVSHVKLLQKLDNLGIRGKIKRWIKSWLENRTQYVEINGKRSETRAVKSGVPQGSVLGPLLFIVYINDLDEMIKSLVRKFADDTKAASKVKTAADVEGFQDCLNKMLDWSKKWAMGFNLSKCKIMHCGRNNQKAEYTMDGVKLKTVDSERDIGVCITANMKPSAQCTDAANKAKAVLNQLTRAFHYRDKNVFIRLYKQFVRPHLEFSSSVWSCWNVADVQCIENVQVKAIKMVSGLNSMTMTLD